MSHSLEIGDIYCYNSTKNNFTQVHMNIFNTSTKKIKYITFTVVPYNAVLDKVNCTLTNTSEINLKFTGPLNPYDSTTKYLHNKEITFRDVWHNTNICEIKITRIHIQYMDNTEEFINSDNIIYFDNPESIYHTVYKEQSDVIEKEIKQTYKKIYKKESYAFAFFLTLIASLVFAFYEIHPVITVIAFIIAIISVISLILLKFKPQVIENIIEKIKNIKNKK